MRVFSKGKYSSLIVVGCIVFFFLLIPSEASDAVGIADEISSLSERVKLTYETFMRESLFLRLNCEYGGQLFTEPDRRKLRELAETAHDRLAEIAQIQIELKEKIENYTGDDWEDKYGSTGLWRKLFADIYCTTLSNCQIDFYIALTAKDSQGNKILHEILTRVDSLDKALVSTHSRLLKAKAAALLGQTELVYKPSAISQLDLLISEQDPNDQAFYFRAIIEKIKLVGKTKPGHLEKLTCKLAESGCADDFELILSLAFLQRQLGCDNAFEKIIKKWPQTEDILASALLSYLSELTSNSQSLKEDLQQISAFEAELAAMAAWKAGPANYAALLEYLAGTQNQSPLILYAAAISQAEVSPKKTIDFLIQASQLQRAQKSDKLTIEAEDIAREAAYFATSFFHTDYINYEQVFEAFENYYAMVDKSGLASIGVKVSSTNIEDTNRELAYLLDSALINGGRSEKSKKLAQQIAAGEKGSWRNIARIELLLRQLDSKEYKNQEQLNKLLSQLYDLIKGCCEQNKNTLQIRAQAMRLYCELTLESTETISSERILSVLSNSELIRDPNLNFYKSKALFRIGQLEDSVKILPAICDIDHFEYAGEALELLTEIIDQIDFLAEQTEDFTDVAENCTQIAQFCYDCLDDQQRRLAGLYLIEAGLFSEDSSAARLQAAEEMLENLSEGAKKNDPDLIRCRARLLCEQGKFERSAELWSELCQIRKNPKAAQQSWKWWRAKFYELHCWMQAAKNNSDSLKKQTQQDVLHTIEVLENSFSDIPQFWAGKLSSLKRLYSNQPKR